jgi:hypothetical protein
MAFDRREGEDRIKHSPERINVRKMAMGFPYAGKGLGSYDNANEYRILQDGDARSVNRYADSESIE